MLFLIFAGAVSLVFGIALLVSPQSVRKLEEKCNKSIVVFEERVHSKHTGVGISLLLVSLLCFFVAYYLAKKHW
jgi:uncharacterized membrane protein HdeD (DUF308 family)